MNKEIAMQHGAHQIDIFTAQILLALPFIVVLASYLLAVFLQERKPWPWYRTIFWITGTLCAVSAVAGPIASLAHTDFTTHMAGHLLLGMLAPLLMVLAAPVTLLLRTLPVSAARQISRVLRSRPAQFVSHPVTATVLNIGGLWVLYTTNLYILMHESLLLYLFVHIHVFLAGYVFTAAIIYIDPIPHRMSFPYRMIVFMIALAGHAILSKYIYAYPPEGVSVYQAEAGGMLMYYGGDVIDGVLIFVFFLQWYKVSRPRAITTNREADIQINN